MFVYKVLSSSKLVCASYDHIYVPIYHNLLPEGICCCLQTCNFVVMFMLMYKVLNSSELVCASIIYVPFIMYCLRLFVVVLQELHCLQKN